MSIDSGTPSVDDPGPSVEEDGGEEIRRGRLQTSALPHRFRPQGLQWSIGECWLDGDDEVQVERAGGTDRIPLAAEREWTSVTLTGSVTLPSEVYDDVVPWTERGAVGEPPTKLVATVDCKEAILRDAELIASPAGPGTHEFEITFRKDRLYGEVKITPTLVRRQTFGGEADNCATVTGARLAEGAPASIVVDQTDDVSGLMCPKRKRFSEEPEFPPESHLVYMVLEGEDAPQLYLNDDHDRVVDVLDTHANQGLDAEFRDVAYDLVEAELWPQFIISTATEIDADGEPEYNWQWDVLRQVAGPLYGDSVGPREAAHRLRETVRSPDELAKLQMEIEDFVQNRVGAPAHLRRLLKRVKE